MTFKKGKKISDNFHAEFTFTKFILKDECTIEYC